MQPLIASNVAALIDGADALIEAMQWKSKPTEGTQEELPVTMSPDEQSIADYLTANGEDASMKCVSRSASP